MPPYGNSEKKVIIESISGDGTVSLLYDQKKITLKPKETSYDTTTRIENLKMNTYVQGKEVWVNCTREFIVTDRFYNAGILNKSSIVFSEMMR
jgi:hypothetical protein